MSTELYDIEATVPAGATPAQIRIMLQQLLADRFGLIVHREIRQLSGYRLVVAKGGAKLKQSAGPPAKTGDEIVIKNGIPGFSESAGTGEMMSRAGTIFRGRYNSIAGLTDQLAQVLQGPVVDATGITGEYDYDLSFQNVPIAASRDSIGVAPDGSAVVLPGNAGPALTPEVGAEPNSRPTLWEALKEQLGLQLDAVKSVPVEVLVLDKAHQPTAN